METKKENNSESSKISSIIGLIATVLAVLVGYYVLNSLGTSNKFPFQLLWLILIATIIYPTYLIIYYSSLSVKLIENKYLTVKSINRTRLLISKDIKQEDQWHIINKKDRFNLTEEELEEHVAWLLKKGFIEIIGRAHPLNRLPNEPIYDLTAKGNKFLEKHKNKP